MNAEVTPGEWFSDLHEQIQFYIRRMLFEDFQISRVSSPHTQWPPGNLTGVPAHYNRAIGDLGLDQEV
jgi:hypothetical protein